MKPWDLFDQMDRKGLLSENSLLLHFEDVFWKKVFVDYVKNKLNQLNKKIIYQFGKEINHQFTDSFNNLSLFPEDQCLLIEDAQLILDDCLLKVLQIADAKILFFTGKLLAKHSKHEVIKITATKSWEEKQSIDLLLKILQIDNGNELVKKLNWPIGMGFNLDWHYNQFKIFCFSETLVEENIQISIMNDQDKFSLIGFINQNQMNQFWKKLFVFNQKFEREEILRMVQFAKSHVLKIIHWSFSKNENKLGQNKYEKEIIQSTSLWPKKDILELLKSFSQLEILLKGNQTLMFKNYLYLKIISGVSKFFKPILPR